MCASCAVGIIVCYNCIHGGLERPPINNTVSLQSMLHEADDNFCGVLRLLLNILMFEGK